MPRLKLTSAAVEKLNNSNDRRREFFDTLLPGLALRITKRNCKTWVLFYRPQGKLTRLTLGRYPVLTLSEARDKARLALQEQLPQGYLQQHAPRAVMLLPAPPQRIFKESFAEYIERYAKLNTRTWKQTEGVTRHRVFPHWGHKDITTIRKSDVVLLLDGIIEDGAATQANLTFAHIRKFFNWCVERAYIERSPCEGLKLPTKTISRDRVLADDEVKCIWKACDSLTSPFGDLIKVLLLTGQRRSEVAEMCWDEISDNVWIIPKARTKNNTVHYVPLTDFVKHHLDKNNNLSKLIFTTNGETPVSGFSKMKDRLDELSSVTEWRIHDLRRTAATGMARLGIAPHIVEKVLNHKSGEIRGVAAVYNRHTYIEECQNALTAWSSHIKLLTQAE
ncbi:MAG: site-specific integrase [Alphaproteobacteria bacterium]|nr:site-specific integrase [Alphaproteobacteria bacterium]